MIAVRIMIATNGAESGRTYRPPPQLLLSPSYQNPSVFLSSTTDDDDGDDDADDIYGQPGTGRNDSATR